MTNNVRSITNRAKYSVPNGTNVSFTTPFTIAYALGNAEAPDGEGYFFFEQVGAPDTLYIECKGIISGSGTVFTMTQVLDTSESDNSIPAFTSSTVDMRANFGATLMDNVLGIGAKRYRDFLGQSGMVGLGHADDFQPQISTNPLFWSQFPVELVNQPEEILGKESVVQGILTDPATTTDLGIIGARYMQSSLHFRQDSSQASGAKRPNFQTSGIAGGHCIEYIEREGNGELVVALPYAKGATSITEWQKGGDLYEVNLRGITLGLSDGISILDIVDVHQGENDVMTQMLQATYEGFAVQMVSDMRADLTALAAVHGFRQTDFSTLRVLFFGLSEDWNADPGDKAEIDDAHANLPNLIKYCEFVPSTGFPGDGDGSSGLHIKGEANIDFGIRGYLGEKYAAFNDDTTSSTNTVPSPIPEFSITELGLTKFALPSFGFPKPTMTIVIATAAAPGTPVLTEALIAPYTIEHQMDISTLTNGVDYVARTKGVNGITADGAFTEDVPFTASVQVFPLPTFKFSYPTTAGNDITQSAAPRVDAWLEADGKTAYDTGTFGNPATHIQWATGVNNSMVAVQAVSGTLDKGLRIGGLSPTVFANDLYSNDVTIFARIQVPEDFTFPTKTIFSVSDEGSLGEASFWAFWVTTDGVDKVELELIKDGEFSPNKLDITSLVGAGSPGNIINVSFAYGSSTGEFRAGANGANLSVSTSIGAWTLPSPGATARMYIGTNNNTTGALSPGTAQPMKGRFGDVWGWGSKLTETELNNVIDTLTSIPS